MEKIAARQSDARRRARAVSEQIRPHPRPGLPLVRLPRPIKQRKPHYFEAVRRYWSKGDYEQHRTGRADVPGGSRRSSPSLVRFTGYVMRRHNSLPTEDKPTLRLHQPEQRQFVGREGGIWRSAARWAPNNPVPAVHRLRRQRAGAADRNARGISTFTASISRPFSAILLAPRCLWIGESFRRRPPNWRYRISPSAGNCPNLSPSASAPSLLPVTTRADRNLGQRADRCPPGREKAKISSFPSC